MIDFILLEESRVLEVIHAFWDEIFSPANIQPLEALVLGASAEWKRRVIHSA